MSAFRHDSVLLSLIKRVDYIQSILRKVTVNLPLFDIANENTPDQLTADQNNYVVGNYDLLRFNSSSAISITGLRGGIKGRFLRIFNVGSYPITLAYQDANSSAENRFNFSNGKDAVIAPSSNVTLYYDYTQSRWIGADPYTSGAVYLEVTNSVAQTIPDSAVTTIDPGMVASDQYSFYDDANNKVVIQFDGTFRFLVNTTWDGVDVGARQTAIWVDGSPAVYDEDKAVDATGNVNEVNLEITLTAGQEVQLKAYQDSGVGVDILTVRFTMSRTT